MQFDALYALISEIELIGMQYIFYKQHLLNIVNVIMNTKKARKTTTTISEGVDEMGCIVANATLDLCRGGLQEVVEVKPLKVVFAGDEIAYHGNVKDSSLPTSISCLSTS
jgi:hypothetical protein